VPASSSKVTARPSPVVLTIGHSTRTIEDFIRVLQAHGVTCVADVRTIPRSRHNPQFNRDTLPTSLKKGGIEYVHVPELGGLRRSTAASPNTGWRNASFRGFADYMQTPGFQTGLTKVLDFAHRKTPVLMCAEALPWRCHRSLVADALLARGVRVEHIMSATKRQPHRITPFAKVYGRRIKYPAPGMPLEKREATSRSSRNRKAGSDSSKAKKKTILLRLERS
jgi:uncharacterized protein (DUF488 family)